MISCRHQISGQFETILPICGCDTNILIDLVENHDLTSKFQIGKSTMIKKLHIGMLWCSTSHFIEMGLCLLPAMLVLHEWDEIDVGVVKLRVLCRSNAKQRLYTSCWLSEIGKNESWWSLFFKKAYARLRFWNMRRDLKSKEVKYEAS